MKLSSISTITELKVKFTSVWLSAFLNQAPPVFSDVFSVNFVLLVLFFFSSDISSLTVFLYFHIYISSLYFHHLVQVGYRKNLNTLPCLFYLRLKHKSSTSA